MVVSVSSMHAIITSAGKCVVVSFCSMHAIITSAGKCVVVSSLQHDELTDVMLAASAWLLLLSAA